MTRPLSHPTAHPLAVLALVLVAVPVGAPAVAQTTPQDLAAENFLSADADADGALTFEEFKTLIALNAEDSLGRAQMVENRGMHGMAFSRIDANGDGVADQAELAAMAARAQR